MGDKRPSVSAMGRIGGERGDFTGLGLEVKWEGGEFPFLVRAWVVSSDHGLDSAGPRWHAGQILGFFETGETPRGEKNCNQRHIPGQNGNCPAQDGLCGR